jgi:hypothetical protein
VGKTAAIRKKSADSNNTKINQIKSSAKPKSRITQPFPFLLSLHFFLSCDPHPLFLARDSPHPLFLVGVAVMDALPNR